MDLLAELKKNPFVLAPMAGVTDNAFRSFMKELGAHILVTELVSAHGIRHRGKQTLQLMKFEEVQRPVGIQLFGEDPEAVAEGARFAQDEGADFVDLNFGCPVKKVVSKGAGSAILKDLPRLRVMLRTVKSALEIPLTIKIRTGWDDETRNADEVAQIAYDEGITWVAIHGRTREQGYSGEADWEYIAQVKSKSKLPILGNGDIHSPELANRRIEETSCDGVMIGRGCLKNPWIFKEALELFNRSKLSVDRERDFDWAFVELRKHLEKNLDERRVSNQIRKFAAWFSAGYPGSVNFRKQLFQTKDMNETISTISAYFGSMGQLAPEDTSRDKFMMGGHG